VVTIQLVVTSIKDFLRKLKGVEAASAATEGTVPRHIPEPSFVGQESQLRQSGLEYAPTHSVRDPDLPNPSQVDRVLQEWVTETGPRSGLDYSSDEERRGQ